MTSSAGAPPPRPPPPAPVSAAGLARAERARRDASKRLGRVEMGCPEVDRQVLIDGFERGSVVGISAEEEQMGAVIGMQTIANALAASVDHRVMVISAQPQGVVAVNLRDAIRRRVGDGLPAGEVAERVRACLERVSIARIFDLDGLWEVLRELGGSGRAAPWSEKSRGQGQKAEREDESKGEAVPRGQNASPDVEMSMGGVEVVSPEAAREYPAPDLPAQQPARVSVVPDSQAYDGSPPEDMDVDMNPGPTRQQSPVPEPPEPPTLPTSPRLPSPVASDRLLPTIILIPQMSSLLNGYFASHDKQYAHKTAEMLGHRFHQLSRTIPSSPLILLLNGTTTTTTTPTAHGHGDSRAADREALFSIFNTPPPAFGLRGNDAPIRRVKPSFGRTFDQLVDVHFLCTKIPKTIKDAEAVYDGQGNRKQPPGPATFVWAVEVLRDGIGVWACSTGESCGPRRSRYQRWGVVDFREGRVVDAFAPGE